jgi:HEAT repeat protein
MKPFVIIVILVVVAGAGLLVAGRFGAFGPGDEADRRGKRPPDPRQRAWDTLTELLNSHDEDLRAETLEIVSVLRDDRVPRFLSRALERDESAIVRVRAAGLQALAGRKDLLPFVRTVTEEDDDYETYVEAARAYARIDDADGVRELTRILTVADDIDSDEDSQAAAALALARMGVRDAVPRLREGLESPDSEVVHACACALLLLGETDVLPVLQAGIEDDAEEIAPFLAAPGNEAGLSVLTAILESDEPLDDERGMAAEALAVVGTDAARKVLVGFWGTMEASPDGDRRYDAELRGLVAAALARIGDDRGLPTLLEAARGEDEELARAALRGLALLGRGVPVSTLVGFLAPPEGRPTLDRQIGRAWAARAILVAKE